MTLKDFLSPFIQVGVSSSCCLVLALSLVMLNLKKVPIISHKCLVEPQPASNDPLADFKRERLKYKAMRKQQGKKGSNREDITLSILNKFKSKLDSAKSLVGSYSDDEEKNDDEAEEEDGTDLSW